MQHVGIAEHQKFNAKEEKWEAISHLYLHRKLHCLKETFECFMPMGRQLTEFYFFNSLLYLICKSSSWHVGSNLSHFIDEEGHLAIFLKLLSRETGKPESDPFPHFKVQCSFWLVKVQARYKSTGEFSGRQTGGWPQRRNLACVQWPYCFCGITDSFSKSD